jgi:Uma2 family endonuclease
MSTAIESAPPDWTVADLLARFGPILYARIRHNPPPGTATEQDVIDIHDREDRLYELVDGVLVEKAVGLQESFLAEVLARLLGNYADQHDLGFILGADGMARLAPGMVRIPDVSFVSWRQFPNRSIPRVPMLNFAPDLAVEVLRPSNTAREMDRKLHDYFAAGVRLVWYVDPVPRTVQAFTAVDQGMVLAENEELTGDPVLPSFVLPVRELFARLE